MHAVLLAFTFGQPRDAAVVSLSVLVYAFEAVVLYTTNPLFMLSSHERGHATALPVSSMQRVTLTWATSAAEFSALYEELCTLQNRLRGRVSFSLRVYIHSASESDKKLLRRIACFDPAMRRCIFFSDLDVAGVCEAECKRMLRGSGLQARAIKVFSHGPTWLTDNVLSAVNEAREKYEMVDFALSGESF